MQTIDKKQYYNELYDWYSELLTIKQQEIFCLYYHEDLSLMEIAEQSNVSRAAISDLLKRVIKILIDYEKKLKLVEKYHTRREIYGKIKLLQVPEITVLVEKLEECE